MLGLFPDSRLKIYAKIISHNICVHIHHDQEMIHEKCKWHEKHAAPYIWWNDKWSGMACTFVSTSNDVSRRLLFHSEHGKVKADRWSKFIICYKAKVETQHLCHIKLSNLFLRKVWSVAEGNTWQNSKFNVHDSSWDNKI